MTHASPRTRRPMKSCWSFWAASIQPQIPCSPTTAHGSNISRKQISARWLPSQATRQWLRQDPRSRSRRHRSRARRERNKMNNNKCALLLALLLAATTPAFAQEAAPPSPPSANASAPPAQVPWSSLSPDQQKLLSRFGNEWSTLPPERQQALARGSQRWLGMSPDQRGLARQRFDKFKT